MTAKSLPSPSRLWTEIGSRFDKALWNDRDEICRLIGLFAMFGPLSYERFTGDPEREEMLSELAGLLVETLAYEVAARDIASRSPGGLGVGQPENQMIRHLGPRLVGLFLRYSGSGGRHSVLTSVDGKLTQIEAGPLLEFASRVLIPLNEVVVEELKLRPLSAARVIRYGLEARRSGLEPVL